MNNPRLWFLKKIAIIVKKNFPFIKEFIRKNENVTIFFSHFKF